MSIPPKPFKPSAVIRRELVALEKLLHETCEQFGRVRAIARVGGDGELARILELDGEACFSKLLEIRGIRATIEINAEAPPLRLQQRCSHSENDSCGACIPEAFDDTEVPDGRPLSDQAKRFALAVNETFGGLP